jgi:hypothetical protein
LRYQWQAEDPNKTETNIYVPPVRTTANEVRRQRKENFGTSKLLCKEYDCLFGDLSAHSALWDDKMNNNPGRTDVRGEMLEEWLASNNMACLNEGMPTRTNRSTNQDSTFVHSTMLDKFSWNVIDDLGSDHKPIIVTYEGNAIPKVNNTVKYKWRMEGAEFAEEIEDHIPSKYLGKNINKLEKKMRKTITEAANKHVGKKKISQTTKPWLTPDIKDVIKKINLLRRNIGQNRKEWIEECRNVAKLIKEKKEQRWKEYVEVMDYTTGLKEVWKISDVWMVGTHQ